jgi:hypothetical protein
VEDLGHESGEKKKKGRIFYEGERSDIYFFFQRFGSSFPLSVVLPNCPWRPESLKNP